MRRGIILAGLLSVAVVLTQLDAPVDTSVDSRSQAARASYSSDAVGSVWYCPAAGLETSETFRHEIILSNPSEAPATVRLVGFRTEPGDVSTLSVEIPPGTIDVVKSSEVGASLGSIMVEVLSGTAVVEHRLRSSSHFEVEPCVTGAAETWHFPVADTRLGVSAGLWVMNPFQTDASIDVTVAVTEGVRVPSALDGLVIPARSSRYVEMGESIQRRDQFAFTVETRSGRVIAELVQTSDESLVPKDEKQVVPIGTSMYMGVAAPAAEWIFADSFAGSSVSERVIVFNPSEEDTTVSVAVTPSGSTDVAPPEPFELNLTARRFAVVALHEESRVPDTGIRSIHVSASGDTGVVAATLSRINGEGGDSSAATRPSVPSGVTITTGASIAANSWVLGHVAPASQSESVVSIANGSEELTAAVRVTVVVDGERVEVGEELEVGPSGSLTIDLAPVLPDFAGIVLIESDQPVVVAGRATSSSVEELTRFGGIAEGAFESLSR